MTEFERMVQLLELSWTMRSQIVPCLVGPPGIGKTAAVQQHAQQHGAKVVKIVASRCVPSETVGMTMPNHENRSMEIYNSMQLSSLRDGDILFLDELLEADQFVLSTLLTVIESREMADGTPLPDIQIVAATNDTISPEQLKGNIRQRFMFQRFDVDKIQTRKYIFERTGLEVPDSVLGMLSSKGNDYNFLTPRSLTKLCLWVDSIEDDRLDELAILINNIWKCTIGNELVRCREERDDKYKSPEQQIREAVKTLIGDIENGFAGEVPDGFDFSECTMQELLEMLQGLDDWPKFENILSNLNVVVHDFDEPDIEF